MLKIKKIKPMFTALVTTMDTYEEDETIGNLIDSSRRKGTLKEYQKVVAVGSAIRDIKEGDMVKINPERYAVKKHKSGSLKDGVITDNPTVEYRFNVITINNKDHLLLQDRDIDFVIEEYEEENEPTSMIYTTNNTVVV